MEERERRKKMKKKIMRGNNERGNGDGMES